MVGCMKLPVRDGDWSGTAARANSAGRKSRAPIGNRRAMSAALARARAGRGSVGSMRYRRG
jgi:hypothetical protein